MYSVTNQKIMGVNSTKILLIEDNLAEARLLQEILKGVSVKEFSLVHVKRLRDALEQLNLNYFDVILLDLTLPDSQGLESLEPLIAQNPSLPIVVLTNTNDDQLAIEAVRKGAQDYLVKRLINADLLARSICYAIERKQVSERWRELNQMLEKRVQQQTAEIIKVQEINQSKTEFFSMLSHDFRNPLTTILLSTQLLQNSEHQLTREKKLRYFQRIQSAIKNMVGLLDEVVLIGKADSGKLYFHPIPLDLKVFCCQLLEEIELTAEGKHQFIFHSDGDFYNGLWDENLLQHILVNLLTNAIKYSPSQGTIKLELKREDSKAIIIVQDDGIGIPPEDQHLVFKPFQRAANVGSIAGTGLGLAIVKKCVETHGGEIFFHSQEEVGTTFTVVLPLVRQDSNNGKVTN